VKAKQGAAPFSVEMKIVDESDKEMPWDGKKFGRLKVRGVAVAKSYFKGEGGEILDPDGFFDTGDVATIDPYGNLQITDRSKDVIKSGGEWISSIDLENLAVGHPKVMEAAVIGIRHPKWDERPLLIIIRRKARARRARTAGLHGRQDRQVVDARRRRVREEIPHTATGKILKTALRDRYKDYAFPNAVARRNKRLTHGHIRLRHRRRRDRGLHPGKPA
jgi:fatty-acyl-CoA synthase